jgi:cephalosporin hydroxylase
MTLSLDEIGLKHGTDKASNGHDYLEIYEKIMPTNSPITLLEIGWFDGASMKMWREYLHPNSKITGVDIVSKEEIKGVRFINADATKPDFSQYLIDNKIGPLDFIIDDGSHLSPHVIASFNLLWTHIKPGGYYIIEDLHVSYHANWLGWDPVERPSGRSGRGRRSSMEFLKSVTDSVHYGHAGAGPAKATYPDLASIAFHPGLAILQKRE